MSDDFTPGVPPLPKPFSCDEQHWLHMASAWAAWSDDPILRSGCIAVRGKRFLIGAQDCFPDGVKNSTPRRRDPDVRDLQLLSACSALISDACRHGVSLINADIYSWPLPPGARDTALLVHAGCRSISFPAGVPIPFRLEADTFYAKATAAAAGVPRIAIEPEFF
jgi:hypothetical protein